MKEGTNRMFGTVFVLAVCMFLVTTSYPQTNLAKSGDLLQKKQFAHAIEPGWSLISIPYIPSNNSVDAVFASINGDYDAVYWYNSADSKDPWKAYFPMKDKNSSDLQKINNRMGLWIHITNISSLTISGNGSLPVSTIITLSAGWNLIGYPSITNRTVNDIFAEVSQSISHESFRFDASQTHSLKKMADTEVFHLGFGYWVYVSASCQLKIDWQ